MITDSIKAVVEKSVFITLVSMNADKTAHPIVAGKAQMQGDNLVFGIYKMEKTQKNIAENPTVWVLAATTDGGPKGYRLTGKATVDGKNLIVAVSGAEELI